MPKNQVGTLADDNQVVIASTATGRSASGVATGYAAQVIASPGDPADAVAAANLLAMSPELYNGSTFDRQRGANGAAYVTSGGSATTAIASATATDTVVKATPGRLCRVAVTSAAGTTTGNTSIWDNASGHTGTILAVIPNNTAVGTIIDIQMPAAAGITVQGVANSPGMTISYL